MEKFSFDQAQFLAAAFEEDQFPQLRTSSGEAMPEMAIVGRSNVGKSSLINSLLKNQKLAKTSSTPGKTQSLNFFSIDHRLSLVDLPGYGYAKVSKHLMEKWSKLIETYLNTRKSLRLILFLIDSRRLPTEQDGIFMQWAAYQHIPLLLIFTKVDKIKSQDIEANTAACLESFSCCFPNKTGIETSIPFLHYSIKDSRNRMKLIQRINSFFI